MMMQIHAFDPHLDSILFLDSLERRILPVLGPLARASQNSQVVQGPGDRKSQSSAVILFKNGKTEPGYQPNASHSFGHVAIFSCFPPQKMSNRQGCSNLHGDSARWTKRKALNSPMDDTDPYHTLIIGC